MTTSKSLPARPSLESVRKQAKQLARDARAGNAAALERVHRHSPEVVPSLSVRAAQLVSSRARWTPRI